MQDIELLNAGHEAGSVGEAIASPYLQAADSSTATVTTTNTTDGGFTLQILHASDLEGSVGALGQAPNFAALADAFEQDVENTVILSAGDNYIPGPVFSAAGDRGVFRDGGLFNDVYNTFFGLPGNVDN
ncbi:MAG: hypothetical protein ACFB6R_14450, partial [Alphaproteobacteria bacterium]